MSAFHLLHLTDPHLPPSGGLLFGRDPAPRLAAAIADIAARHGPGSAAPAAFAVLTGDLVRDGEPAAYARLAAMLAGLPCPAHLLLGNHDDRAGFRNAFPRAPLDPGGFVQLALPTPAGLCLMLDTHEPGRPEGHLCPQRLGWLADRLAEGTGKGNVLLFLHHPPMPVGIPGMDAIGLVQAEALWQVLRPHRRRIRHLFHGHLHRALAGSWHGIPLSSMRGTAFQMPLDFTPGRVPCAAAPDSREPPCYAVARITAEAVVVHTHEVTPG